MEPIFQEKLGIEHHKATTDIISGHVPLGKDVYSVLRRNRVDVEDVIALISGEYTGFDHFFDGPINFDTIEGVLRSCEYVWRAPTMPKPDIVTKAAIRRETPKDRYLVDNFLEVQGFVPINTSSIRGAVFFPISRANSCFAETLMILILIVTLKRKRIFLSDFLV